MESAEHGNFNPPSWRFHIRHLGPIESANIEPKPLTLFCGPNSAGKTWAMYALYGFFKLPVPSLSILPGLDEVAEAIARTGTHTWDLRAWLNQYGKQILDFIHQGTAERLPEVFNAPPSIFSASRLDWQIEPAELLQNAIARELEYRMGAARQVHTGFHIHKPAGESNIQIHFADKFPNLKLFLSGAILTHLLGGLEAGQAFLMPAERNGLHLFFRELRERRGAVVQSVLAAENRSDNNLSCYAEPIADYIDRLNLLRMRHRAKGRFHHLAERVRKLADCRYQIDDDGNIGFVHGYAAMESGDEYPLDLHLASSAANSLFGLWFYLEFQAKPGDVLFIDGPELNLHPVNQRAVALVLARLVNDGIRVVCSTHSGYLVREFNSLMMLCRPDSKRDALTNEFGYEEEEILRPEQVGAYIFGTGRIDAMPIAEDAGILAKTFDDSHLY